MVWLLTIIATERDKESKDPHRTRNEAGSRRVSDFSEECQKLAANDFEKTE